MSEEIHVEEHSSPVKTPKQLLVVIGLAFAVPIVVIALIAKLATMSVEPETANPGMSEEAIAKRLKPVGEVVVMSKEEREAKLAAAKQATPPPAPKPQAIAKAPAPAGAAPADICAAIRYLLDAPSVTGQMIAVDGGQHLAWKTADVMMKE